MYISILGNFIKVRLDSCITLPIEWNGVANSIDTMNEDCLLLYEDVDCLEQLGTHLRLDSTNLAEHKELKLGKFNLKLRSLQSCSEEKSTIKRHKDLFETANQEENSVLVQILIPIAAVFLITATLLFSILFYIAKRRKQRKKQSVYQTERIALQEETNKFLQGYESKSKSNEDSSSIVLSSPYDTHYEIAKNRIDIGA